MQQLFFITSNRDKLKEAQDILRDFEIIGKDIELPEIQTLDRDALLKDKVKQAFNVVREPVIVEDTSLIFEAWNGLPGPLMKWFLKTVGNKGLLKMLEPYNNRKALAICSIGYSNGKELKSFHGKIPGVITKRPEGNHGFGWDSIFQPHGYNKTFAQMTMQEKKQAFYEKTGIREVKKIFSFFLKIIFTELF